MPGCIPSEGRTLFLNPDGALDGHAGEAGMASLVGAARRRRGVTLPARLRDRPVRFSSIRSPRGGGRANRTTGPRGLNRGRPRPEPLASPRGHTAAGADQLLAAEAGRLVHRALHVARALLAEAPRRSRAAGAGCRPVRPLADPRLTADRAHRPRASRHEQSADPLPRRARREGRADLRDAQVPDLAAGRRGAARPLPRPGTRGADARRDDAPRRAATRDATRRAAAALECPARRHEPRRAAPDPAPLLRAAGERASVLLAAARRPPRPDGLRAGAARLRDVDGGEARPRPRVDRGPLGVALPANARRDCASRHLAVTAHPRSRLAAPPTRPPTGPTHPRPRSGVPARGSSRRRSPTRPATGRPARRSPARAASAGGPRRTPRGVRPGRRPRPRARRACSRGATPMVEAGRGGTSP